MDRGDSLEHTPTWAVSIVCLFIFFISFTIETVLHYLTKVFKRRKMKSLDRALAKIKTEMMKMGFISFLLTISEAPISKICVTEAIATSLLPCKDLEEFIGPALSTANQVPGSESNTTPSVGYQEEESNCEARTKTCLLVDNGAGNGVTHLKGRSLAAKHLHLSFGSVSHPLLRVNNVSRASQGSKQNLFLE
ncbi:hypothetical protein REPUB_Repub04eG0144500 [Reevesia pubescens]